MESTEQQAVTRPAVISFIGVILYAQAFLAAIAAVSLLIWRDDILDLLEREGSPMSSGLLSGTTLGEAITAVLLFVVATGLMRGSSGIRLFVAVVEFLTMGLAIYILVAYHAGGYVFRAVFSLFVGVFVLWALYGKDESDEFFGANEQRRSPTTPTTIWTSSDPNDR